jgi:hypothetical protein
MMLALAILGTFCAISVIAAPVLLPLLARRFARNEQWIEAAPGRHHLSEIGPQVRVVHRPQRV